MIFDNDFYRLTTPGILAKILMQFTKSYSGNHTESFDLLLVLDETITPQRAVLSEPVLLVQFTLKGTV